MHTNILFLIIDELTPTKLKGTEKTSLTPNIDSLISSGVYFDQAISAGSVTVPSIASSFTSKYPFECLTLENDLLVLDPNVETFTQMFTKSGYTIYATIPESLSHTGLKNTLDHIDEYKYPSTLFDGLGEKILEKLTNMKKPWFYYLHISDLHNIINFDAYDELKEFANDKYGISRLDKMLSAIDFWLGRIFEKINFEQTTVILAADHGHEQLSYTINMEKSAKHNRELQSYQPGKGFSIAHKVITKFPKKLNPIRKKLADAYTNRRYRIDENRKKPEIEKIENQNLSVYEKRIMKNEVSYVGHVYDERFRIPLIFVGHGLPKNKIIRNQVRGVDIFPTIAELIGIPNTIDGIRGSSLIPIINDKKIEENPAYLDSMLNTSNSPTTDVIGIRTSQYKYFRNRNNSKKDIHLFDLKKDPHEEVNIESRNNDIVNKMEEIFAKINSNKDFNCKKQPQHQSEEEVKKAKDILTKLGYI